MINETFFINDIKTKFNLSDTVPHNNFCTQRQEKKDGINPKFYECGVFKTTNWRKALVKNRHVHTRLAIHGFHHLICVRQKYHDCGEKCDCKKCNSPPDQCNEPKCICKLCSQPLVKGDQYHITTCSMNPKISDYATKENDTVRLYNN